MATLSQRAAACLAAADGQLTGRTATLGLDGFVDEITGVVDKRVSSTRYTRVPTIAAFGRRITDAAARSSNIELVVERVKLGGNGPIMANALAAAGVTVTYVGNLGYPQLHPAFAEFAKRATVHSIAEPGHTDALEFDDGKLMLGKHASLKDVTWDNLVARVGRDRLRLLLGGADLVGLQNWTMLPFMSDIWERVLEEICPALPSRPGRQLFFDLADPEKRDPEDIRHALDLIGRFQRWFETCLGLNEKEAFEIGHVLGYQGPVDGEDAVERVARFVWDKMKIATVVVHPRAWALAVSAAGMAKVQGPLVGKPLISTGGGDHFNAGFCLGQLIGANDEIALQLGVATSGYYVRSGKSPSALELAEFLKSL